MIFLSKTTAEIGGTLALQVTTGSGIYSSTARLNRVKTLDGGSSFSHFGVTDTDRDYIIAGYLTAAAAEKIKEFHQSSEPIRIGCHEGAFLGFINDLIIERDRKMSATIYFKQKLTS